ncbi:MAG TPA: hypothetical protein PLO84_00415 [Thermotogota bacterium]|nr:hypothetical protein [Thermotogota bacterium]HPJ87556.1 hypothetical protein [Thermotogota bacterium]
MGKSGYDKYDKDSLLLKVLFIIILFTFLPFVSFSESGLYLEKVQPFVDLINDKVEGLNSRYPNLNLSVETDADGLFLLSDDRVINRITPDKIDRIGIISLFLKTELTVSIKYALLKDLPFDLDSESIFEYPYIDPSGKFLVYISDKTYGNRNPFILDLDTLREKEIVIPESSEYFPVYLNDHLYYLSGKKDHFSLQRYSLETEKTTEISNGQISCLRTFKDQLFFSDRGKITVLNNTGLPVSDYFFDGFIQSFAVDENSIYLSMNLGNQFDIFHYSIKNKVLINLTNSRYNEMDVNLYKKHSIIFTSNENGIFNLYIYNLENNSKSIILEDHQFEYFYPFYSDVFEKIIVSVFQKDKEPVFRIIPIKD